MSCKKSTVIQQYFCLLLTISKLNDVSKNGSLIYRLQPFFLLIIKQQEIKYEYKERGSPVVGEITFGQLHWPHSTWKHRPRAHQSVATARFQSVKRATWKSDNGKVMFRPAGNRVLLLVQKLVMVH